MQYVGIKNTLALLTLIDEFIQKDEATRKFKSRNYEKNKLKEMDRKLLEARTKRIEKEIHPTGSSVRSCSCVQRGKDITLCNVVRHFLFNNN
jgi:hypothetical protein